MASRLFVRRFQTDPPATPAVFAFAGDGNSREEDVGNLDGFTVQVEGTFTATVTVEGAVPGGALLPLGAGVTAPGFLNFPDHNLERVRIVVSGHSAGSVEARVAGSERHIGG